jgi:MFS family permease
MSIYSVLVLALLNAISVFAGRLLLALYALHLGAQPLTVGVLAATFSVFPAMFSWHAGRLSDRFGARWLLVFAGAGGGLGLLVLYLVPGMPGIFVAAAMVGLSFATYNVSLQNLVGLLSSSNNRTQYFSNYSLTNSVAKFVGPLIAGFSVDHFDHGSTCLYLILLSLVPVTMLLMWGGTLPGGTRHVERGQGDIRAMLSDRGVGRVLATSSLLQSGQDLFQFYLPVYAHGLGMSASSIGIVLAMSSAAAFVVRLILPRLIASLKEEKVLAYSFFLGAASFMLVPFFKDTMMLSLIAFLFGLGSGCGQPIVTMLMFSHSAEGRSGEALGLRMTVNHLTRLVGPIAFGFIGSALGLPAVFWVNALMLGTGGALSRPRTVERSGVRG